MSNWSAAFSVNFHVHSPSLVVGVLHRSHDLLARDEVGVASPEGVLVDAILALGAAGEFLLERGDPILAALEALSELLDLVSVLVDDIVVLKAALDRLVPVASTYAGMDSKGPYVEAVISPEFDGLTKTPLRTVANHEKRIVDVSPRSAPAHYFVLIR